MEITNYRSWCPISCSLDIWWDKWSLLIIRDIMFKKQCTYGNLLSSKEGISTNILADRLQTLEYNQIIKKTQNPNNKSSWLYTLTQKGIDLLPILTEMHLWADKYLPISNETKPILEAIKKNKSEFINSATKTFNS